MNNLFVLLGPTGVGKTELSLQIAEKINCAIISCDSRQIYRELKIGVAAPTEEQLAQVQHYFIGTRSIKEHYSSGQFEIDALPIIQEEIKYNGNALMVGGSMLYIDAICKGIDDIPTIDENLRQGLKDLYKKKGIEEIRRLLKLLDPKHYEEVDLKNAKRMIHALEVCYQTGQPFSNFRKNQTKKRDFNIIKIGLNRPREVLYQKINDRVHQMIEEGLEQEAESLIEYRELNALNTVGYKEMFEYFDGKYNLDRAIELIQRNTRHYAKKQLSWFNRYDDINWFEPMDKDYIFDLISQS